MKQVPVIQNPRTCTVNTYEKNNKHSALVEEIIILSHAPTDNSNVCEYDSPFNPNLKTLVKFKVIMKFGTQI